MQEKFVLFEKDEIEKILKELKVRVEDGKLVDSSGDSILCPVCQVPLTIENLGFCLHGSSIFICDNPSCAVAYLISRRKK